MRTSGNVPFPSWDNSWVGGEESPSVGRRALQTVGKGLPAGGNIHRYPCVHTQVVTLAGSMVSDPSLGCSSLLKKILYYNNNMNFSLFFLFWLFFFAFFFSISFRGGVRGERKKKCHSSVRS